MPGSNELVALCLCPLYGGSHIVDLGDSLPLAVDSAVDDHVNIVGRYALGSEQPWRMA
jgi:hypothetical protein